jgi:hypothetical protein
MKAAPLPSVAAAASDAPLLPPLAPLLKMLSICSPVTPSLLAAAPPALSSAIILPASGTRPCSASFAPLR